MGWLDIAFDAAILSTQISQRNKLQQLQGQHAEAAMIQAVVQILRQDIFKFKQTGEEVVAVAETYPKQAAGALEILYQRLQQAGLTPDLFPELSDKEYVAATTRYLRDQRERLFAQLTPADQLEVKNVTSTAMMLPRYNAYVSIYNQAISYRDALPIYETLKRRKDGFFVLNLLGAFLVIVFVMVFLVSMLSNSNTMANFSCWSSLLIIAACIFLTQRYTRPTEFKRVKSIVETTKEKVDLDQFATLEKEFGTDYEVVRVQQQAAQSLISQFFAGGNFSTMLSG